MNFPTKSVQEWTDYANSLTWPQAMVIDGKAQAAKDDSYVPLVTPRDGSTVTQVPYATSDELEQAVAAARTAFDEGPWPRMAPKKRKELMLAWVGLMEQHRTELATMLSAEMGKPIADAWGIELRALINSYRWYAEMADKELDEISPVGDDDLALITREPVGVVAVVTPWNFPLTLSAWKIAPALAVGCTVVHKPADLTPLTAVRIAELALEAGIPAGVLNVLPGRGSVIGKGLGLHRAVDSLAFTGSTEVGRAYMEYAAQSNLKRVWLELGGKSPNIILPDAPDLQAAIDTAAWGIFFNTGQMCTAPSRLIVHQDVADEVIAGVIKAAENYQPGDPFSDSTKMGPLASSSRRAEVQAHVDRALADGSTLALGGNSVDLSGPLSGGAYYQPTVFVNVNPNSALAQEEVFGPVLSVTTVKSDEEAIQVANNSDYGLAAGLWTANVSKVHRLARQVRAGTVWVNCYEEGDLTVPFGGFKMSGNGRDKSRHALDKYTELKTTYIKL
ncbi:aldehyde dehydrogenase [Aurantimicrobium minutum]|uniref:aldehyde dehydrogenase n=1 Tax=Aurantimicrobium minutum TaxID=708131 RepID=UPI0024770513|nr:aldehyde dehydrogenase [Aurantimicrobium minutum]MDH6423236.1 gamma-glutamyl-gamma-aminobutyraldehyde dehydrogenase [Aurantimicrobium minutum]